jgi:peptide/nickel transport system substrate-binding protein
LSETDLHRLIAQVREGALPRRAFIQRLAGLGLTAPMASMLLMHAGVARWPARRRSTSPPDAAAAGR